MKSCREERRNERYKGKIKRGSRGTGRWWSEWRLKRAVAGHSWASCGLKGEFSLNAWQIKQDLGYFSCRHKATGTSRRNERWIRDFGREKSRANERSRRLHGSLRQALNRSSPVVNLGCLSLQVSSKMEAGPGRSSSSSSSVHTHFSCTDRWWAV